MFYLQFSEYQASIHEFSTAYYWKEFCAGNADGNKNGLVDAGVDTCAGDSGGPFMCVIDGVATLAGVTSWGIGCGVEGNPGLYADVFKFGVFEKRY